MIIIEERKNMKDFRMVITFVMILVLITAPVQLAKADPEADKIYNHFPSKDYFLLYFG